MMPSGKDTVRASFAGREQYFIHILSVNLFELDYIAFRNYKRP
jgi:hypothetical protein